MRLSQPFVSHMSLVFSRASRLTGRVKKSETVIVCIIDVQSPMPQQTTQQGTADDGKWGGWVGARAQQRTSNIRAAEFEKDTSAGFLGIRDPNAAEMAKTKGKP